MQFLLHYIFIRGVCVLLSCVLGHLKSCNDPWLRLQLLRRCNVLVKERAWNSRKQIRQGRDADRTIVIFIKKKF